MAWWSGIRSGRRLRPTTTAPAEGTEARSLDGPLGEWLEAAMSVGEGVEDRERALMERLSAAPEESVEAIAAAYAAAPEADYALRWMLVYAAARLKNQAAMGFLASVLEAPIPPERSQDIHHFSSVGEEMSQRLQALSGLSELAGSDDDALGLLRAQLAHEHRAVRAIASQFLRELPPGRVELDEIRRDLRGDEADELLALVRCPVEELTVSDVPDGRGGHQQPPPPDRVEGPRIEGRRPPTIPTGGA